MPTRTYSFSPLQSPGQTYSFSALSFHRHGPPPDEQYSDLPLDPEVPKYMFALKREKPCTWDDLQSRYPSICSTCGNPDDRFDGVNENSLFFKANLAKSINRKYQHDIWECRPLEAYLMDGTKWTIDRAIKQENENRYNNAIKKGDKFWQKVVDGNFAFCHLAAVKTEPYYRSVDTDEYYIYNWRKEYFIKAKKDMVKENIAQPHHEPEYVFKEVWVEDGNSPKLNMDGSKWYE